MNVIFKIAGLVKPINIYNKVPLELKSYMSSHVNKKNEIEFPSQVKELLESCNYFKNIININIVNCEEEERIKLLNEVKKWRKFIGDNYFKHNGTKLKKNCIFVLGPMGSGKSTIIQNYIKTDVKYSSSPFIDTDEIMSHLPDFTLSTIYKNFPLARKVSILLTEWLFVDGISFIAEGTCVYWQTLLRFMKEMKENGYSIEVLFVKKPLEIVLKQAANRDRKVPSEIVSDIYHKSLYGCSQLVKENEKLNNSLFKIVLFHNN